jgi:hypothetical protein
MLLGWLDQAPRYDMVRVACRDVAGYDHAIERHHEKQVPAVPATTPESANPKDKIGRTKIPMHLVPSVAIAHTALAMEDGARKYGPYNWRSNDVAATVYISAAERHIRSWLEGEQNASDSKVHHLGHAMACMAIVLDAQEGGNLIDDRPLPGPLPYVLQRRVDEAKKALEAAPKYDLVPPGGCKISELSR